MKVMVAIDGSRSSDQAVSMVPWLGSVDEVVLVHAVDPAGVVYPIFAVEAALTWSADLEAHARLRGADLLERARKQLATRRRAVTTRLLSGPPADAIVEAAREEHADLLLLGARGLGLVKETLLGSVSHRVVTHAPCPVLVLRGHAGPMVSVLLAVESRHDADAMVAFLAKRPFPSAVRIHVLTVVPVYGFIPELEYRGDPSAPHSSVDRAHRFAAEVADRIRGLGYQATAKALLGWPADEILEHGDLEHADLIVLGTRGPGPVSRFVLGSVAHAVTHRATCPVLVIRRPSAAAEPARLEPEEEVVR